MAIARVSYTSFGYFPIVVQICVGLYIENNSSPQIHKIIARHFYHMASAIRNSSNQGNYFLFILHLFFTLTDGNTLFASVLSLKILNSVVQGLVAPTNSNDCCRQ